MEKNSMVFTRAEMKILVKAMTYWSQDCDLLTPAKCSKLLEVVQVRSDKSTNWSFMIQYIMWLGVGCLVIALAAFFSTGWFSRVFVAIFWDASNLKKSFFFAVLAGLIYWYARRETFGSKYILILSAFVVAVSLTALAVCLEYPSIVCLMATGIYGLMAIERQSNGVWLCALLAFGQWYGIVFAYHYGSYYIGLSAPLHFLIMGLVLFGLVQTNLFSHYPMRHFTTTTLVTGIMYSNIALWILSIVGYHPEHQGARPRWSEQTSQVELMGWGLVWLASSIALVIYGTRFNRASARRLAFTFGILNLYTKFFEHFWNTGNKALFFAVLGASLWFLGYRMKMYFFPKVDCRAKQKMKSKLDHQ